jgi:hypothetical protein
VKRRVPSAIADPRHGIGVRHLPDLGGDAGVFRLVVRVVEYAQDPAGDAALSLPLIGASGYCS